MERAVQRPVLALLSKLEALGLDQPGQRDILFQPLDLIARDTRHRRHSCKKPVKTFRVKITLLQGTLGYCQLRNLNPEVC